MRDPFFSMLKRSMATFMNAFTASDWTMYPFSTQNRKDFYNLMSVYLDAVFYPRLDRLSFQQEGHRLEFETVHGTMPEAEMLVRKGVVYNEMKGAMSSADQVAVRSLLHALFPTSAYRFNSGGDPRRIPDLTHDQLLAFHRRHYHPSNAFFYSYGDLPIEEHLAFIEERVLRHFERIDPRTDLAPQPRWSEPQFAVYPYPIDRSENPEKKHQATVGWLTADITDSHSVLVLSLIEEILLGNPASPLRKSLIDSGLGSSLSDGTGYATDYRDTLFAAGLKEVEKTAASQVEALVIDTLGKLVAEGIAPETIESAIHQVEFSRKEKTNHPYPYGLKLLLTLTDTWIHGGNPLRAVEIDRDLDRLRRQAARGGFFEEQIERWLIDNPHRIQFVLEPDPMLEENNAAGEREELDRLLQALDEQEKAQIRTDAAALETLQQTEGQVSVLPTLTVEDIPEQIHTEPETGSERYPALSVYERPTGGIVYVAAAAGIGAVPAALLKLLPFFCYALPKLGTRRRSYEQISRRIDLYTGGLGLSPNARTRYTESGGSLPFVSISAKSLDRNVAPMFALLDELVREVDFFAPDRLRTLVAEFRAGLESAVVHNGHRLALSLAARSLTPTAALNEQWGGVHQLRFVKDLAGDMSDARTQRLAESLHTLAARIFSERNVELAVIGDEPALVEACAGAASLADGLPKPAAPAQPAAPEAENSPTAREGWATASAVSFVAKVFPAVRMSHHRSAGLALLAKILRSRYLHREIREKGGAYGGLSLYNPEDGLFSLVSYRDPHIVRTLDVYERIVEFLEAEPVTDNDISEAKLQVCSDIDRPDPPGPAARKAFYRNILGLSDAARKRFKQRVRAATGKEVATAAKGMFGTAGPNGTVAVISGQSRLEEANRALAPDPLALRHI